MAIQKIRELVLRPSQVTEQIFATLTRKQQQLKTGVERTDFVKFWSNPAAVNQVPTSLADIVAMAENSVTLADVRAVWGIGTATTTIVEQLKGLFYFSESAIAESGNEEADKKKKERKITQLMETAGLIADEFYFLTMQELCCFFRRAKTGMYGQLSWGNAGINVQQLFCAMRDFQRDRKAAYDNLEAQKAQNESLERRAKDYVGTVQNGIEGNYQRACESFEYFLLSYPPLRGSPHAVAWWEFFKQNPSNGNKAILDVLKTQNEHLYQK